MPMPICSQPSRRMTTQTFPSRASVIGTEQPCKHLVRGFF